MKEDLLKINIEYLDKINIPDNPFGIEIEFAGALYKQVERNLKQIFYYDDATEYWMNSRKIKKEKYETWKLVKDATVQKRIGFEEFEGGEINSPILTNNKKSWEELKQICEFLRKQENIKIDDNCAIHIHTDKKILPTIKEVINLLKLWIVYEDIIYKFSYGEIDIPRKLLFSYAKPYGQYRNILELINKLDKIETLEELMQAIQYERKYGLNLLNLIRDNKTTLEKRTSNGTLNEKIIQNDVRFTLNLINYAKKENFDEEFIKYKLKNYEPIFLNKSVKEDKEKAEELATRIFKEEIDKLYFYKQYYKTYNQNDIEKTLHL